MKVKMARHIKLLVGFLIVVLVAAACDEEEPRVIKSDNQNAPDITGPSVVKTVPADGDTNVFLNVEIEVTFSEEIDTLSVNGLNLIVGDSLPGTVSFSPKTIKFGLNGKLTPHTNYTVTVDNSITDLAGNGLKERYQWTFTTGSRIILPVDSFLVGSYNGIYSITTDFGSNQAVERHQPITWVFTDTTYAMKIDTFKVYDLNFAICQVDGRYTVSEGIELAELHAIPDPFTACKDKENPTGLFVLTKSSNADTLTMRQLDAQIAVFKEIVLIPD